MLKDNLSMPKDDTSNEMNKNDLNDSTEKISADSVKDNYDMFMLQRVKALQHVNPTLKALLDLQGTYSLPVKL